MSIEAAKIAALLHLIAELPDELQGQAAYLKGYFDENPEQLMAAHNALIDALAAETAAGEIGSAAITGLSGATVQAKLAALKAAIDGVTLGEIPDASLTVDKLGADVTGMIEDAQDAADAAQDTADTALSTSVKSETGSYTGAGTTGGSADKTVLTFLNVPKIVIVVKSAVNSSGPNFVAMIHGVSNAVGFGSNSTPFNIVNATGMVYNMAVSWDDTAKSVSWYCSDAVYGLNNSGSVYRYISLY